MKENYYDISIMKNKNIYSFNIQSSLIEYSDFKDISWVVKLNNDKFSIYISLSKMEWNYKDDDIYYVYNNKVSTISDEIKFDIPPMITYLMKLDDNNKYCLKIRKEYLELIPINSDVLKTYVEDYDKQGIPLIYNDSLNISNKDAGFYIPKKIINLLNIKGKDVLIYSVYFNPKNNKYVVVVCDSKQIVKFKEFELISRTMTRIYNVNTGSALRSFIINKIKNYIKLDDNSKSRYSLILNDNLYYVIFS